MKTIVLFALFLIVWNASAQDPKWDKGLRVRGGEATLFSTNNLREILNVSWPGPETPTNLDKVRIEASQKPEVKRENGKWVVTFEEYAPPATNNPARVIAAKVAGANRKVELMGTNFFVHYDYELTSATVDPSKPDSPPQFEAVVSVHVSTGRAGFRLIGRPMKGVYTHTISERDNPTNWVKRAISEH